MGVFASLKTACHDKFEQLYRGGLDVVGKEYFISIPKPVREGALAKRNAKAGWASSGLFPFNPESTPTYTKGPG